LSDQLQTLAPRNACFAIAIALFCQVVFISR
jgi:hypothetical protein